MNIDAGSTRTRRRAARPPAITAAGRKAMARRAPAAATAAALIFSTGAMAPMAAQSAEGETEAPKVGCLRGRPLPACRSFWIFEVQGLTPLAQSHRTITTYYPGDEVRTYSQTTFENALEWNLGHMANVGERWAAGGELTVSTSGRNGFGGIRARVRRWLSPDVSVEAEGGMLALNANGIGEVTYGATADLRLNIRDQGSFFVRWDGVRLDPQAFPNGYSDAGGPQQAFVVGVGAGSIPALVGTGVGGVAYLALWAILVGSSN